VDSSFWEYPYVTLDAAAALSNRIAMNERDIVSFPVVFFRHVLGR
jgi:hypothetical protein